MNVAYDPKPLTANQLHQLSQDVKLALTDLYGEWLEQVILYGSYARGDFHAESDVDYLVVLRDEMVQHGAEIRFMSRRIGELSVDYDLFVSVKPTSVQKYRCSQLPYYLNVREEGILL